MAQELDGPIARDGTASHGRGRNILGQRPFPKASCDAAFVFGTNRDPGRMLRGAPHGYFSRSGRPEALFETLHDMSDIPAIIEASARHDVGFLPPHAND